MWGDLPVFENPPSGVPFKTSPEDYDKAGPRAWSDDNVDGELRRIFNPDEVIDLGETKKIIIDNLVHPNAATGTNLSNNIIGFSSWGTTLGSSTEWALTPWERSLKIHCPGTQSGERAWVLGQFTPFEGKSYAGRLVFKGTEGDSFIIVIQGLNSPYTVLGTSTTIIATGSAQVIDVSGICPAGATQIGVLIRKVNTNTNPFYIGAAVIIEGNIIPEYDYIDSDTGNLVKIHKNKETEFYIENGIIKVEPTPDCVKIYAFESLPTDNQHNVGTNLTGFASWSSQNQHLLSRDTTIHKTGGGSARLRSFYNGQQNMTLQIGVPRWPVIPGEEYYLTSLNLMADFQSPIIVNVRIDWRDSGGNQISLSQTGVVSPENLEWFTLPEFKVTAPEGAATAYFYIYAYQIKNNDTIWYDSGQFGRWKLMEEIPIGDNEPIRSIKIVEINREQISVQINRTTWTIRQGDPVVKIDHPYDDLKMLLGTSYYHDGITTNNPIANADISMQSQNYCIKTIADAPANLRTLLIQMTPTTIKSDKIPATQNTGIGVYDPNETPSSPSGYLGLVGWFVNRGRQKMKLA